MLIEVHGSLMAVFLGFKLFGHPDSYSDQRRREASSVDLTDLGAHLVVFPFAPSHKAGILEEKAGEMLGTTGINLHPPTCWVWHWEPEENDLCHHSIDLGTNGMDRQTEAGIV